MKNTNITNQPAYPNATVTPADVAKRIGAVAGAIMTTFVVVVVLLTMFAQPDWLDGVLTAVGIVLLAVLLSAILLTLGWILGCLKGFVKGYSEGTEDNKKVARDQYEQQKANHQREAQETVAAWEKHDAKQKEQIAALTEQVAVLTAERNALDLEVDRLYSLLSPEARSALENNESENELTEVVEALAGE